MDTEVTTKAMAIGVAVGLVAVGRALGAGLVVPEATIDKCLRLLVANAAR